MAFVTLMAVVELMSVLPIVLCFYVLFLISSDALYRLTFSLKLFEKSIWVASEPIIEMCKTKGASDADCHNYVMVLHSYGNQLYACGTHAFSPQCSWRQVSQRWSSVLNEVE